MSATPTSDSATRSPRGRRRPRATGDEREAAILQTAEGLLAERSIHEISIDEIARGAGISRPTFYFYFSSKEAVLLALVDRLVAEAHERRGEALDRVAEDPPARIREGLSAFHEVFGAHRAVGRAAAEARAVSAEIRELWGRLMETWVAEVAEAIDSERARGAAPDGVAARDLAIALISMNERVLHATLTGETPAISEDDVVDVLLAVWLSVIYGGSARG